jgi:hypothetical protein
MYRLRQRIESRGALSKLVARYTGSLYLRIMYRLRQRIESRVALSKPVARYTGSLYLRIMYQFRQRVESRGALSKPVATCMGVDQIPITKKNFFTTPCSISICLLF